MQSEDSEDVSEYDIKDEIDVDNIKTEHSEDECATVGPETYENFEDRKRDPLKLEPDGDISNSISASILKRSRREVEVNQIENPHNNWHKIDYNMFRGKLPIGEGNDDGFWKLELVDKALRDVNKGILNIHIVSRELGVTTEMLYSQLHKKDYHRSSYYGKHDMLSLREFIGEGGESYRYWSDSKVRDLLDEVRNRKLSDATVAAQLGVSRGEVYRRCGGIRTKEEIEAEQVMLNIQKVNDQEEAYKLRVQTTDVDRQIWFEEEQSRRGELCDYEKQRLENLRERKAMMEMLDVTGDKLEIRRLNRVIRTPGETSEKNAVGRREKSSRIQRLSESKRLKISNEESSVLFSSNVKRSTPYWFCDNYRRIDVENLENPKMPKFDVKAAQLLEVTNDYRKSRIFFDSISQESREMKAKEEEFCGDVDLKHFGVTEDFIVSTSAVTTLDSCGDLVSFGTAEGGVGVVLGGRSVSLRPHSAAVTGLEVSQGTSLVSSSWDGTVRRLDLVRQLAVLEHSAAEDVGVLGLVSRPDTPTSFILDCDHALVSLDTRQKGADTLVSLPTTSEVTPASINLEPVTKQLVSVCRDNSVKIWDLRKTSSPVWSHDIESRVIRDDWQKKMFEKPDITFAGWSSNGEEFCVAQNRGPYIFDVINGVPHLEPRASYLNKVNKHIKGTQLTALRGDLWSRWGPSELFCVKYGFDGSHDENTNKNKLPRSGGLLRYGVQANHKSNGTRLMAVNSSR